MNRLLHPMPGLLWSEIRDSAVSCARHGWPICPGTYQLDETDRWWGRSDSHMLEPAEADWPDSVITDPDTAEDMWSRRPYNVLLACGPVLDVIELPRQIGKAVVPALHARGSAGPVVTTPYRTMLLIVDVRSAPHTVEHPGHSVPYASWVPLPPSSAEHRLFRWEVSPEDVDWKLPAMEPVWEQLREITGCAHHHPWESSKATA